MLLIRAKISCLKSTNILTMSFTGTHADCQSVEIGVTSLTPFTQWAREHRKRGFLGEFGAGANPICLETLDRRFEIHGRQQ